MPHRVIFTAEEVRAYMSGRKTQFRRVVKYRGGGPWSIGTTERGKFWPGYEDEDGLWQWIPCPFGRPGDRLVVAETYGYVSDFEGDGLPDDRPYLDAPELNRDEGYHRCVIYRACGEFPWCDEAGVSGTYWRPSTTMPRWASRLKPEVTEVRVERVQDITDEDVVAEGIDIGKAPYPIDQPMLRDFDVDFETAFRDEWDARNPGHAWDLNEWVWAVTVKPYEEGKSR